MSCTLIGLSTSGYYYRGKPRDDIPIIEALTELAEKHPDWGFWKMYRYLRENGKGWNHKRVYRIYGEMHLKHRRKHKKRLPARVKDVLLQPLTPNYSWSMDFMADSLINGRRFRVLNIIDDFNREILSTTIDTSIRSERVIRELNHVVEWRGVPESIRVDNGPEFIAGLMQQWCEEHNVKLKYIQPGSPTQNAFVERFNRTYREGVLNRYLFENLAQVKALSQEWMWSYNHERPHAGLGHKTPRQFLRERSDPTKYPSFMQ